MEVNLMLLPLSMTAMLRHAAFITHLVPAERIHPHLPTGLELETIRDGTGHENALITVGCFQFHGMHWALLPLPRLDFEQLTYRTYVRLQGRPGVYFFGTWISSLMGFALQRAVALNVFRGDFDVRRVYGLHGYEQYAVRVNSRKGDTWFTLRAHDRNESAGGLALTQHLTFRPHGYIRSSFGLLSDLQVSHHRMRPWSGELVDGRFGLWERFGILSSEEARSPVSVLIEPEVRFWFLPPTPVQLQLAGAPPVESHRVDLSLAGQELISRNQRSFEPPADESDQRQLGSR